AAQRPLQLRDLAPQLAGLGGLALAAGVALLAGLQQLVTPGVVERLGDLVVATQLLHGLLAAQASEHDPELLLGREGAVLALLGQGSLRESLTGHPEEPVGRADPRWQSLRRLRR